jgi:CheY-like chemotaxis protein
MVIACRILVVNDSESFRRTAAQLVAARGLELLPAVCDGEAALAAVSAECPGSVSGLAANNVGVVADA